jgi:small subunit ribosomal protein S27Ae
MADDKKTKKKVKEYKPGKSCPKCGSRLADHEDRMTCGKCGYTEWKKGKEVS